MPERRLPADFAPNAHRSDRDPQAAENHRTGVPAAARKVAVDDRAVVVRDEIAALAVAPAERADAGADVWHDAVAVAQREKAERRRDRHDAELQVRDDRIARAGELVEPIDRRRRALVEPDADARVEIPAEGDQIFAANGKPTEVADVEREEVAVVHQHVVPVARIL